MTNIWLYSGAGNPYNIILSDPTVARGAASVSMALAAIEGADLCSAAMDLVAASSDMSLAAVEGADTASGAVALVQSMILAATEGADLVSASMALAISMALSAVEGADLCAASMDVVAAGSVDMALDATEGADTCFALMDVDSGIRDNQAFRIYNLRKKKRKPRVELVLDMDLSDIPETIVPRTVPEPVIAHTAPSGASYRVTALDLAMVRPMEIKVRPKPVYSPIQTLAVTTAEDERKKKSNHALRLLLLAS